MTNQITVKVRLWEACRKPEDRWHSPECLKLAVQAGAVARVTWYCDSECLAAMETARPASLFEGSKP
jgi:hypothetical protein